MVQFFLSARRKRRSEVYLFDSNDGLATEIDVFLISSCVVLLDFCFLKTVRVPFEEMDLFLQKIIRRFVYDDLLTILMFSSHMNDVLCIF